MTENPFHWGNVMAVALVYIGATALCLQGCGDKTPSPGPSPGPSPTTTITTTLFITRLQSVVDSKASFHNYSLLVGYYDGLHKHGFAGSRSDHFSGRHSQADDDAIWGSVTKLHTGVSVLRLVDSGKIGLDDKIAPYVDPIIKSMQAAKFSSISDLFGQEANSVTIRHLLGMKSGIPDFDTATMGVPPTDKLRQALFDNPAKSYSVKELLSFPWVGTGKLNFPPGTCNTKKYGNCYSSTNYMLLGMILAHVAGKQHLEDYDQRTAIPNATMATDFPSVRFATTGRPSTYTKVHGYDETSFNGNKKAIDTVNISGVLVGWTASDFVANAADAANLAFDIYAVGEQQGSKLISNRTLVKEMWESSQGINGTGYGLATFDLSVVTGVSGEERIAYGHYGSTYGYQSAVAYFPSLNFSVSMAANVELDRQDHQRDVLCALYNAVRNMRKGLPIPTCKFSKARWHCDCEGSDTGTLAFSI